MAIDYISSDTATLFIPVNGREKKIELLWGDRVRVVSRGTQRTEVRARGMRGFVKNRDLNGNSLLEVYFIDVGQGDGVLIRTPDHRHVLIDGGYNREKQPTGKNAADFVDWKFAKDYGKRRIELDAMIASHNDADHYGGLWDLINPEETDELNLTDVRVEACYHAGISWWKKPGGGRWLGPHVTTANGSFFSQLLGSRNHVRQAVDSHANPQLQGEWAQFMKCLLNVKRKNGSDVPIQRLSHVDMYVPGFAPGPGSASLKILAPVEFDHNGQSVLRRFGSSSSWNTNGNSLLLRLDYGRARILLTGDLNSRSQRSILEDYDGERQELQCDVAKACHHGSEDISYEFMNALRPAVTVISSGDNEGHDHPRPNIVAASATTGYLQIESDEITSPLIYSTEIARSVSFGKPTKLTVPDDSGNGSATFEGRSLSDTIIEYKERKAGDLNPKTRTRKLGSSLIVGSLIYGLVNVRTDGNRILCATMNEKDHTWQIKTIRSRF